MCKKYSSAGASACPLPRIQRRRVGMRRAADASCGTWCTGAGALPSCAHQPSCSCSSSARKSSSSKPLGRTHERTAAKRCAGRVRLAGTAVGPGEPEDGVAGSDSVREDPEDEGRRPAIEARRREESGVWLRMGRACEGRGIAATGRGVEMQREGAMGRGCMSLGRAMVARGRGLWVEGAGRGEGAREEGAVDAGV